MDQNLGEENNQELEDDDDTDEFEIDVNAADDYDSNTMIRVKDKVAAEKAEIQKDESPVDTNGSIDNELIEEVTEFKSPPKTSDEEKSPSNEEEESEVIKIGEMYVRLDNGSTMSENITAEDDDGEEISNLEEEIVEHYTESGKQEECVSLLSRLLRRKFGVQPQLENSLQALTSLPLETLENLADDLLDFNAIADLEAWLVNHL